MNGRFAFGVISAICVFVSVAAGDPARPLATNAVPFSPETVNLPVTIEGRLTLEGSNYFLDGRFVIVDDAGNQIPVTTWSPLEVPPSPPDGPKDATPPHTMQQDLGRRLSVTGIHRVVPDSLPTQSILGLNAGDHYIDVLSVTNLETGVTIFDSAPKDRPSEHAGLNAPQANTAVDAAPMKMSAGPALEGSSPAPVAQQAASQASTEEGASPVASPAAPAESGPSPAAQPSSSPSVDGPSPVSSPAAPPPASAF
jgi:hypothetical protein